jgi:hypothetical protein
MENNLDSVEEYLTELYGEGTEKLYNAMMYAPFFIGYANKLNKPCVSNSLPDFIDVIKARIDYFKSINHTYEAADLQNVLNTIIRLVPPINFQIGQ